MTLKDKIEMQAQDTTKIYLYKEGIFYKVYNEGAFLLNDLGYKVSVENRGRSCFYKFFTSVYLTGF